MANQFPDGFVVARLGDTSGDYAKWKASVLQVRELPEYKLRKLWKLNFSARDIELNKHWAIFPPDRATRQKRVLGRKEGDERGRSVSAQRKSWLYARALRDVAQGLLDFNRLQPAMRMEIMKERDNFAELMQKYAHKQNNG